MRKYLVLSGIVLAAIAAQPRNASAKPPRLGDPVELMKMARDDLPCITFAQPFIRVSPNGDKCIYIRRTGGDYTAMLHIRTFGPPVAEHAVPAAVAASPTYWTWGFSGRSWRADGLRVGYLMVGSKDGMADQEIRHRLGVGYFDWTVPLPQQSGGGLDLGAKRSHTSVTYACRGTALWRAESDLRDYASCRVVGPNGVLYKGRGFAIHDLSPSPDNRHIAWTEVPAPRRRRRGAVPGAAKEAAARAGVKGKADPPPVGTSTVIVDTKTRKVVRRIPLSMNVCGPVVWAAGGDVLCYGDVVKIGKLYRREVKAMTVATGDSKLIVRDAKAVGVLGGRLVCNRGPACTQTVMMGSSYMPPPGTDPRPQTDSIVLCDLDKDAEPIPLRTGAYAQQVVGDALIYAEINGSHVIVWKVKLADDQPTRNGER